MGDLARLIGPDPYDLVVVGGGINGVGIARDAALRGLRVLLADRGDLCGGTTRWSTRLIHGGLRYLEHLELPLVRESLREREVLLRQAPHLVRPLPFLLPIYRGDHRGKHLIRLGMLMYDALSFGKSLERHRMLGRAETLLRVPGLRREGLVGSAVYWDSQVEYPERLVVELALDARRSGATLLTYAELTDFRVEADRVTGVRLRARLAQGGGFSEEGNVSQEAEVGASMVINVTGPWVDEVLSRLDRPMPRLIGGTKGTHLVVGPFRGAPLDALYVEARRDRRPFFVVPWAGRYLIGTTDSRYDGPPDRVVPEESEIEYLLAETNRVLPDARLARADVLLAYSGVRPLPYQRDGAEAGITRRHLIHDHAPQVGGLLSVVGGKLTTYRSLAEEAVDLVQTRLERVPVPATTARRPLPGSVAGDYAAFARTFALEAGLDDGLADRLLRVYGGRAREVARLAAAQPELACPLDNAGLVLAAEVIFALDQEMAQTLADVLLRRTMIGLELGGREDLAQAAAGVAVRAGRWSEERAAVEVADYEREVERLLVPAAAGVAA